MVKTWKVRGGFTFPRDRERKIFYKGGTVFACEEAEVKPYQWMVEEVNGKEPDAPPLPRKRGRPPGRRLAILTTPIDRAMS